MDLDALKYKEAIQVIARRLLHEAAIQEEIENETAKAVSLTKKALAKRLKDLIAQVEDDEELDD